MSSNPRMRVRDGQRGTALIEFALILPFMLVITLCVVDLSRAFYFKSLLGSAAREGARNAVKLVDPLAGADGDTVTARATRVLLPATNGTWGLSSIAVTVTVPTAGYDRCQVSGNFNWLYLGALNLFGPSSFSNPQTLLGIHTMRIERRS